MKKLLFTLLLAVSAGSLFAQQTYKPINYTFIINKFEQHKLHDNGDGTYSSSAEMGQGMQKYAQAGTVLVNIKDSVITINDKPVKSFKILRVEGEKVSISEDHTHLKNQTFLCKDNDSQKAAVVKILRQTKPGDKQS